MFIHAVYPSMTASSSFFAPNRLAFPPSPPQSPPKQHYLSSSSTKQLNSLMWQSTWHVVQSMASSHHDNTSDHDIVLLDTHQPVSYITSSKHLIPNACLFQNLYSSTPNIALDPLFQGHPSAQLDTSEEHKATTNVTSRSVDYFRQFAKLNEKFADQIVERYRSDDDISKYILLMFISAYHSQHFYFSFDP